MKLLVFAHIPPPHHGQSYMVKLMLDHLGGDARSKPPSTADDRESIQCYHVNCRYSDDIEDIGSFRLEKAWLVLRYCLEAAWCRFRYGVRAFYYVPAPGKRAALYRDWIVMLLCRPIFSQMIFHWHAGGLGDWLHAGGNWFQRTITHWLLGRAQLSISLAIPSMRDALWFESSRVEIVPYGIPDPCPAFTTTVALERRQRLADRRAAWKGEIIPGRENAGVFRVLYLSHCTREKGIFDTLEGVALANQQLAESGSPARIGLDVAGEFLEEVEREQFDARIARDDLAGVVRYHGFVADERKHKLLTESDAMCFPTYYHAETFGIVIVEALAFGLPVITTRWRATPEILPSEYPGFVAEKSPEQIAAMIRRFLEWEGAGDLRRHFERHYLLQSHIANLRQALYALEELPEEH